MEAEKVPQGKVSYMLPLSLLSKLLLVAPRLLGLVDAWSYAYVDLFAKDSNSCVVTFQLQDRGSSSLKK